MPWLNLCAAYFSFSQEEGCFKLHLAFPFLSSLLNFLRGCFFLNIQVLTNIPPRKSFLTF